MKQYLLLLNILFIAPQGFAQNKVINKKQNLIESTKTDSLLFQNKISLDTLSCGLNLIAGKNYKVEKTETEKLRRSISLEYSKASDSFNKCQLLDSASMLFTKILLNNIIPYWYETKWDFNGYTAEPKQGTIACGYFVSTTLRDMGLNLNRYKLAQQGPVNEAKTVVIDTSHVHYFYRNNIYKSLLTLEKGLYFIGLDNHVGYLYINHFGSFFIHSNYLVGKVMIEPTQNSEVFNSANYCLAPVTNNRNLMVKWLTNGEIVVKTE